MEIMAHLVHLVKKEIVVLKDWEDWMENQVQLALSFIPKKNCVAVILINIFINSR